jgi:hypothetical protein
LVSRKEKKKKEGEGESFVGKMEVAGIDFENDQRRARRDAQ